MAETSPNSGSAADGSRPVDRLRDELARRRLDGFVVPRADEHQGEYVPPCAERLAWLTGFTGSAGLAVVLDDRAALFVDGRYTLQAAAESDGRVFALQHLVAQPPEAWPAENLAEGRRLGFDPWLHTADGAERLAAACARAKAELVACEENPLDAVWLDRPPSPAAPFVAHPLACAGRTAEEKRADIAAQLAREQQDAAVLSAPDSIAWLLNIRGGDVPFAPLPLAFAVIAADAGVRLFADERKFSPALRAHLGEAVACLPPAAFGPALDGLAGRSVRLDPAAAPEWVRRRLAAAGVRIVRGADPCQVAKACKNPTELEGMRRAHRRDGAALVRFLAWFEEAAAGGGLTETAAAERLDALRAEGELYRGPSFPTIAAAGPNGAIVHYRPLPGRDRAIAPRDVFLLDSGGQYLDGTTDVTRTVAVGEPKAEVRHRFTLVLKGHIALAALRFPAGTTGSQIDALARRALWAEGLDYDHGTGHGVGAYLSVHEGPQRISKIANSQPLLAGMVLSDEPGFYQAGAYGIRIENLLAVRPWPGDPPPSPSLGFEVLTLAPIDRALIERDLLDEGERAWLDAYHARVREALAPLLDTPTAAWLERATRPL